MCLAQGEVAVQLPPPGSTGGSHAALLQAGGYDEYHDHLVRRFTTQSAATRVRCHQQLKSTNGAQPRGIVARFSRSHYVEGCRSV
jgi:hypothetical protein